MNVLAAYIDLVVIVWRDGQRHGPNETIFQIGSDLTTDIFGPHFDIAGLTGFQIENFNNTADAA